MKTSNLYTLLGLMLVAEQGSASVVGTPVGQAMVQVVGGIVPIDVGTNLPLGFGGVASIALVSLVIGTQLIKRKK